MPKFSAKNIEFKDDQQAIFGTDDDSYISWNGGADQLEVSTTLSGVDPTSDGHFTTKKYVDDVSSTVFASNMVYVDKNGNDTTASGTFYDPYLTIEHALSTITDSSSTNRYVINVSIGDYVENNPLCMKPFISLIAYGPRAYTSIIASDVNSTIISGSAYVKVEKFFLRGATNSSAIYTSFSGTSRLVDIIIGDCNDGVVVDNKNALVFVKDIKAKTINSTIDSLILVNKGEVNVSAPVVLGSTIVNSIIKADGPDSYASVYHLKSNSVNVTNGLYADNQGEITAYSNILDGCTNAIRLNNGSLVNCLTCSLGDGIENHCLVEDLDSTVCFLGGISDDEKMYFPSGYDNASSMFLDKPNNCVSIHGRLSVGRPGHGLSSKFGGGDSYTKGMVILTTDSTTSSGSDGGNLTDVSADATTVSGSTFTFQGTSANHSILIGSTLYNSADKLKAWGIKMEQTVAAVEVTKRSFVTEYWDGSVWSSCSVMSTQSYYGYVYSNELFTRANSSEHISCGVPDDWTKKTINGDNTYWLRVRITNDLTTSPVFESCKIQTDRFRVMRDGYNFYYGKSRFKQTLLGTGNIYGESGGVLDSNVAIGLGSVPTGWSHVMKNNRLNGNGDAIYLQFTFPRGICTSCPLVVNVLGHPSGAGASSDGSIIISVLPIEVQGVLVADPGGGVVPTERTLSNTAVFTGYQATVTTKSVPFVENTKIGSFKSDDVDISSYYQGDVVAIRVEMDDDGTGNKDFVVWAVEVSGVKCTHGERLQ